MFLKRNENGNTYCVRMWKGGENQYGTDIPKVFMQINNVSTTEQVWWYEEMRKTVARLFPLGTKASIIIEGGDQSEFMFWYEPKKVHILADVRRLKRTLHK